MVGKNPQAAAEGEECKIDGTRSRDEAVFLIDTGHCDSRDHLAGQRRDEAEAGVLGRGQLGRAGIFGEREGSGID